MSDGIERACASPWIDVRDRLPDAGHPVIVAIPFGSNIWDMETARLHRYSDESPHYWVDAGNGVIRGVTHWCERPLPPSP